MRLKKGSDVASFIRKVGQCQGEVLFCTKEGDILNLKSILARYIFATIAEKPEILYASEIVCREEEDKKVLNQFLMD